MKAFSFNRQIALTACFLLFGLSIVFGQQPKLHMFIVTQNASEIGSHVDKQTMSRLAQEIQTLTGKTVSAVTVDAKNATESYVDQLLGSASIGSNDAVWFYYSGHGITYNNWPKTDETELKETWVHERLKSTGARLTLVTYDCCNWDEPIASTPVGLQPKMVNFVALFFESKGNYISASCKSGQYSYGSRQTGGMYTNVLVDALKNESSLKWENVFDYVKGQTLRLSNESGKTQEPVYASENPSTTTPIAAPSLRIRETDSVDGIITKLEKMIPEAYGIQVDISVNDLKRWNPGFDGVNLKPWVGKKFNYEPEDTQIKK